MGLSYCSFFQQTPVCFYCIHSACWMLVDISISRGVKQLGVFTSAFLYSFLLFPLCIVFRCFHEMGPENCNGIARALQIFGFEHLKNSWGHSKTPGWVSRFKSSNPGFEDRPKQFFKSSNPEGPNSNTADVL